jgi:outer membrane protein
MKNISIGLNVVLIIAVAILYFLHFSDKKTGEVSDNISSSHFIPLPGTGIVFVNSDSLLEHYEFYKNAKKQFEESQGKIKNELKTQGENLQKEIEQYQQQAIGMTDVEKAHKEEQLAMKQQQIMARKEELLDKLDAEQSKSSEELYNRLNQYLKKYNKDKNYNYVLGFQKGGGILFANDSLNITKDVVEGLNKEYAEEKK